MITKAIRAAAFALLFQSPSAVASWAQDLPVGGGPGGVPFRRQCEPNEYLVGFAARVGSWVDAIRITCAPRVAAVNYRLAGRVARGAFAGGRGGSYSPDVRCSEPDTAVSRLDFVVTGSRGGIGVDDDPRLVTGLSFRCSSTEPPNTEQPAAVVVVSTQQFFGSHGMTGREVWPAPVQRCPPGTLGIGIHGRAGEYLDALGLVCGPAPMKLSMGRARLEPNVGIARVGGGGIPVPPQPAGTAPLKLFWNAVRGDNFTTPTAAGEQAALSAGYAFSRVEGYVFTTPVAGTVPLKLFWNGARGDNFTAATAIAEQSARDAGYAFVRVEGYVFPSQQPGTVPLKLFWSGARGDNFSTATPDGEQAALGAGYAFVRVEGYVFPATATAPPKPPKPHGPGVDGVYASTFTLTGITGPCSFAVPQGTASSADMTVTQPAASSVGFALTSLSPVFGSDVTTFFDGTQVTYSGPVRLTALLAGKPTSVPMSGTLTGTIDGKTLNLQFRVSAAPCAVNGTIAGTRK